MDPVEHACNNAPAAVQKAVCNRQQPRLHGGGSRADWRRSRPTCKADLHAWVCVHACSNCRSIFRK
eukprot:314497-Chlamydomonas_euryale.AAC.1